MSLPTEFDFAVVKIGDGADPEVFSTLCGLTDGTINFSAAATDRFVRDCTKPGEVPYRKQRITGKSCDVSASGLTDKNSVAIFLAALGVLKNYEIGLYAADGTDAGELLGTLTMASHMTAANLSVPREGDATSDITLPSHGQFTWDPE